MKNSGIFGKIKKMFGSSEQTSGLKFDLRRSGTYSVSGDASALPSELVIPPVYHGLPVAYINSDAFKDCTHLASITLPDSILCIFDDAFTGCAGLMHIEIPGRVKSIYGNIVPNCPALTSITVSPENTNYYSEGNCLINRKTGELQSGCRTSMIPDDGSIKSIGRKAFCGAVGLSSVAIPDSVTRIGYEAFDGCTSLAFTVYENARYLGNPKNPYYALIDIVDKKVPACTVHPNTKVIADFAFSYYGSLTGIAIPDSVKSIGSYAFTGCSKLESVTVGNGVTSIGDHAFDDCTDRVFTVYGNGRYLGNPKNPHHALIDIADSGITSYAPHPSTKVIAEEAFKSCESLTHVTIPDGVTSIGDAAFYGHSTLTSVTLGNDLTAIGVEAFYNCSSLMSVTIPDSVTRIGDSAFEGCESLTSVTVGNGVTRIDDNAFVTCRSLTSLTLPASVTSIGSCPFMCCSSLTDVSFCGTRAMWASIDLAPDWKGDSSPFTVVHCTDGDVDIQIT